jgi:hypothetical protein
MNNFFKKFLHASMAGWILVLSKDNETTAKTTKIT